MTRALRAMLAALCGALAVLFTVIAVGGGWLQATLLDTDHYLATVGPLAEDRAVRTEVARLAGDAVADAFAEQAADRLPDRTLAAARDTVAQIALEVTASEQFGELWLTLNRSAHTQLVRILHGDDTPVPGVTIRGDRLLLDLSPVVETIRAQAEEGGVTVDPLPSAPVVDVAGISTLARARPAVRRLELLTTVAPGVAAACAVAALTLARRRARTLVLLAIGVGLGMFMIFLAVQFGTTEAARLAARAGLPSRTGEVVVTGLVRPLRATVTHVGLAAAAVGAVGLVLDVVLSRRRGSRNAPGKIDYRSRNDHDFSPLGR